MTSKRVYESTFSKSLFFREGSSGSSLYQILVGSLNDARREKDPRNLERKLSRSYALASNLYDEISVFAEMEENMIQSIKDAIDSAQMAASSRKLEKAQQEIESSLAALIRFRDNSILSDK